MSDPSDTLKQDTKGAGAEPQPIEYMATDGGSTSAVGLGPGDWILGMTPEHSGWDVYNNEARKVDIELVKDWTASLNFLLVFAAIFAAVLTAFIVESKKRLEQDPTSVMVDVMIFYTNNLANGTHTTYQMPSFEPNRSDIVVNCLFFASLSASLLAALASVVALQWVADYDAAITRGGSSPQDRAKRRQFRYAGVVRWKMGEIIAALPILLYCSVILFLIGLIIWLSNTHQAVGAIVTVGTGLAVSFYAIFTMIGIVFVSAPFRTPLTRWLYSLSQLPFFLLYPLTKPLRKHEAEAGSGPESRTNNPKSSELSQSRLQMTVSWLEKRAFAYSIARKRDDLAVNANDDLGKNALVWLANQISISVDSYRRLLLLVGELPGLNKASPSFDPSEAPWYSIFDTLGASFFSSVRYGNITPENMRDIGVLQRCHAIPAVEKLVKPAPEIIYTENPYIEDAWRNYYGTWTSTSEGPNRLFLLLRELPSLSTNKIQETEILVQLAYWRNQRGKKPDPWHRILALEPKLSAKFFDECVALFGRFCRSQSWNDVFALWIAKNRNAYLSIADTMVQVAVKRADLSPQTIILLVQGHESLVTYSQFAESPSGTVLARPLVYGQQVRQRSENGSEVHDLITLLLARSLNPFVKSQGALQARIREVIAMLWLRPSNPIGEDFETLEISDIMHPAMPINWTRQADQIPHILEILGRLARFRAGGFTNVPLWRGYAFNQTNDPHFVETVQSFDCLMASGCTEKDHCLLVDLICQDLELENAPDFEGYFNPDRLRSLSQLKDPCLQTLANCARGQDFMEPINPIADYQSRFRASYSRIFQHLQTKYLASTSSTILESQASLWPAFSESDTFYIEAIAQQDKLSHLQSLFKYPVRCTGCVDGPGHLIFHLLNAGLGHPTSTDANSLDRTGPVTKRSLIVNVLLTEDERFIFETAFSGTGEICQRLLKGELDSIMKSQSLMLTLISNVVTDASKKSVLNRQDLEILHGAIRQALQFPPDPESCFVLPLLSRKMLLLREKIVTSDSLLLLQRRDLSNEALKASQLLLTELATRIISGRQNSRAVSCARAARESSPALGWLPPY